VLPGGHILEDSWQGWQWCCFSEKKPGPDIDITGPGKEGKMNYFDLFWIFLLFLALLPSLKQRMMEGARVRLIREIEKRRGSRVILLIHRQESMNFLGIPILKYIDINDSEQILRAIRMTPPDMPIDLIIHTPGGLVLAAEQIARALKGSKRYVLQQFLNDKKMIDKRFNKVKPYPQKVLEKFLKLVQPFFKEVELRA